MLIFLFNTFAQNYISTKSTPGSGNIYHTGGNLGFRITEPQTLLHLSIDHNQYSYFPAIRLQNTYPKSFLENYWDICKWQKKTNL